MSFNEYRLSCLKKFLRAPSCPACLSGKIEGLYHYNYFYSPEILISIFLESDLEA